MTFSLDHLLTIQSCYNFSAQLLTIQLYYYLSSLAPYYPILCPSPWLSSLIFNPLPISLTHIFTIQSCNHLPDSVLSIESCEHLSGSAPYYPFIGPFLWLSSLLSNPLTISLSQLLTKWFPVEPNDDCTMYTVTMARHWRQKLSENILINQLEQDLGLLGVFAVLIYDSTKTYWQDLIQFYHSNFKVKFLLSKMYIIISSYSKLEWACRQLGKGT